MCGVRDLCGCLRKQNMYGDRRYERALQVAKIPPTAYAGWRFCNLQRLRVAMSMLDFTLLLRVLLAGLNGRHQQSKLFSCFPGR